MKDIQIKEVMIPLEDYVTIKKEDTLYDVFQTLEASKKASSGHAHRDAIVVDDNGQFLGKLTITDVFRALEPNYKNLTKHYENGVLTKDFVLNAVKDFRLWKESVKDICERGSGIKVSEIMHVPEQDEYVQEEESLEQALNRYVLEVHQPLIVKNEDQITGVLRFGDLYEVIREQMLSCTL